MANFLGYDNSPLSQARFIILPVPYDKTTSYIKGTTRGPSAIIRASANIETYDEELLCETYKKTTIHTHPQPALNFFAKPEKFIPSLKRYIKSLLKELSDDQTLISLGGEHSISYPIVNAYQEVFKKEFSVLHLDAHSDLRESFDGSIYSHACVMKRILDSGVKSIVQVGIRNLAEGCMRLIRQERHNKGKTTLKTYFAHTQHIVGIQSPLCAGLCEDVYVTIDLDVFDPSVIPAVGTPEPGGLGWYEVLDILRPVFQKKRIIGFDVVELCPMKGSIVSDFIAAKLVYRLMGYLCNRR
ncbi:MAG: agmatinase [Planctomycetota bacterium]|nr:agmatinase [Planctomycetota bacterium]MDI6788602.1 agmatinase [Planctomycetota bacterium]